MKHKGNAARRAEIPIVFRKNASNLSGSPVLIICRGFHDDCYFPGPITFVDDLLEMGVFAAFAGSAFDCSFDVVVRHALGTSSLDGAAQSRVAIGIAAAGFGGDTDLFGQFTKNLAAFGVDG